MINNNTILHMCGNLLIIITFMILMTSSCSAVIYSDNLKEDNIDDIVVDPSLSLNKNHIPILEKAKVRCTNPTIKNILIKIIETIRQKQKINSNDMELLIRELGISPIWISYLKPIVGDSVGGNFFCFPGVFFAYFFRTDWSSNFPGIPYIGPSIILCGLGSIEVFRLMTNIEADYYATIGFLGIVYSFSYEHYSGFDFAGIGLLTISLTL